jgi:hypothetical protein
MRWQASQLTAIDAWRATQKDEPSRAVAIRRLVELGLAAGRMIPAFRASEEAPARRKR